MKILLVNDYGTLSGGAETIVLSLREELRRRGHDARLFTSTAATAGLPNLADATGHGTSGALRTPLQVANPWAARALRQTLADFRPDVVHVNLYLTQLSPLILPAIRGIPSVYYAQWYRAICPVGTRRRPDGQRCHAAVGTACLRAGCLSARAWPLHMLQARADRAWGGAFHRVTAISRAVAESLEAHGAPHLRGATVVHPGTGVVEPRQRFATEPTIVAAGRLVPEKGIDVLLRAFREIVARIPAARLVIAGDGPEGESLRRLAIDLGIASRVSFRGYLSRADVREAMRAAWVCCVPSVWAEPFGLVAAEAQMEGVPVVASRTGGLAEIVRDGVTGRLVEPGDVNGLAAAIHAIIGNRTTVDAMGRAAHADARARFDLPGFCTRFETIYGEIAAMAATSSPSST
jgi:glycosyltransferase involved in cell wall biosynthesis